MDLRIFIEPQQGATYSDQLRVAKAVEDLGFDGFFRSDHFQFMGDGDGLPGPTDSWVTLGALARETSRIRLGTLVNAATFRLPGPLAIAVAQVDEMSGGRVELGLGTGWFGLEHRSYGIPFPDVRERFEPRGAALAARFADEYNVGFNRAETAAIFGRVREAAAETGRELVYSVAQPICVGRDEAELQRRAAAIGQDLSELRETGIAGAPAEVVERIGEYAELGAARVYLQLLDLADLDHLELVASDVLPQL